LETFKQPPGWSVGRRLIGYIVLCKNEKFAKDIYFRYEVKKCSVVLVKV